jgi:hypothetical protein
MTAGQLCPIVLKTIASIPPSSSVERDTRILRGYFTIDKQIITKISMVTVTANAPTVSTTASPSSKANYLTTGFGLIPPLDPSRPTSTTSRPTISLTATPTASIADSGRAISLGFIAGIVILCCALSLIAFALTYWCCIHRRRRKFHQAPNVDRSIPLAEVYATVRSPPPPVVQDPLPSPEEFVLTEVRSSTPWRPVIWSEAGSVCSQTTDFKDEKGNKRGAYTVPTPLSPPPYQRRDLQDTSSAVN